ncbi:MAG: type I phosphomannose isomerase catalytic subunit [Bacteroidota bacterium]|nr:type I phosphomannose isomerase catalytic subunit [Bacteroidota bacterium]
MLYPLKFRPIFKEKLWGSQNLNKLSKKVPFEKTGESWEISGIENNLSVVSNGALANNNILNILKQFEAGLVGKKNFSEFAHTFPLLIKYIDADDDLSVQVHPDDKLALKRHNENGKNEIWYIVEAKEGAEIIIGMNGISSQSEFEYHTNQGTLPKYLQKVKVKKGEFYFVPAGTVHSIGQGILIAEIQQPSDLTYRIDDRNRKDKHGNFRELHTNLAKDAIDYTAKPGGSVKYNRIPDRQNKVIGTDFFSINFINLQQSLDLNYEQRDSFTVLMCTEGKYYLAYNSATIEIKKGDTLLVPAVMDKLNLYTDGKAQIIEIFK